MVVDIKGCGEVGEVWSCDEVRGVRVCMGGAWRWPREEEQCRSRYTVHNLQRMWEQVMVVRGALTKGMTLTII